MAPPGTVSAAVCLHRVDIRGLDAAARQTTIAELKEFGIDVDGLTPSEAGARVAAAPIGSEIVDAIDQWA